MPKYTHDQTHNISMKKQMDRCQARLHDIHPCNHHLDQVQTTCTANCRAIDFSFISSACACCLATAAAAVSPAAPSTKDPPPLDTPLSAWAVAASQGQLTPDGRMSRVDAHTGFILAALLCALVGALSLISLLRCALHYCGRRSSSAAVPPAAAGAGLKKRVLRRMPVAVYEAAAAAKGGGAECAICLGEFADGDAVRLLPRCRHGFHVHCIDTWLSAHSSCPICRDSLLDMPD